MEKLLEEDIIDAFPDEKLFIFDVSHFDIPWYADIANYLAVRVLPKEMTHHQTKKFFAKLRHYLWKYPYLFRNCASNII